MSRKDIQLILYIYVIRIDMNGRKMYAVRWYYYSIYKKNNIFQDNVEVKE